MSELVGAVCVQICSSWGSRHWCEWETLPKPFMQRDPCFNQCFFSGLFQSQKGLTHKIPGGLFLWDPEMLNQECSALREWACRDFRCNLCTLPSNLCVPGLGFYLTVFVVPLDFSNEQWSTDIKPEGQPLSSWRRREHNIQMTHSFVGEARAACHSVGLWSDAM